MAFLGPKKFWKFFLESSSQNKIFDTKINFLSYVDTKLWPFKSWRYQKIAKFWKAHNTPPRGPRAKKFWFSKFLPRGYLHAKNDQNRWDKGVKLLWSALEWAYSRVKLSFLCTYFFTILSLLQQTAPLVDNILCSLGVYHRRAPRYAEKKTRTPLYPHNF